MVISGKTKVCALIGDPVEHSMSPAIHNVAFKEMGLDYVFVTFRVKTEDVPAAIGGMRALDIKGLCVTMPHKVAVPKLLDKLDPLAEKIGAINTIVNDDGVLTGYNTDATGFLQAMLERGIEPKGKNIVILGAGGASRAVSFILADRGANLTILNRLEEFDWAVELARRISQTFSKSVEALELNKDNLIKALAKADILVNATSVGMSPNVNDTPVPAELLKPDMIVYDVIYNPIKTRLLKDAEAIGAEIISGVDMLVWQGVMAFEKWTGKKPTFEPMKAEALKYLEIQ
jgi:shikimate dehydrogenase